MDLFAISDLHVGLEAERNAVSRLRPVRGAARGAAPGIEAHLRPIGVEPASPPS